MRLFMYKDETTFSEETTAQNETSLPEDNQESSVDLEALQAENAKLRAIVKRKSEKKDDTPGEATFNKNTGISPERLDRLELRSEGYTSDQIDAVMDLGGPKALEKESVKKFIKSIGKTPQDLSEQAADFSSSNQSNFTTKGVKSQQVREMSSKDILEQWRKNVR